MCRKEKSLTALWGCRSPFLWRGLIRRRRLGGRSAARTTWNSMAIITFKVIQPLSPARPILISSIVTERTLRKSEANRERRSLLLRLTLKETHGIERAIDAFSRVIHIKLEPLTGRHIMVVKMLAP